MSRRTPLAPLMLALCVPCASLAATLEVHVRDGAGQPVEGAAVYALGPSGASDAKPGRVVAVEQVDREFVPLVTVIQTGTTVTFPNRDPILHHIYSFSPAKSFEIKLYAGKSPTEVMFDKPGVVTLGCNIHDWMLGYIVVVATPHHGKTDAAGLLRLRDLPAGAFEVRAWHPQQRAAIPVQAVSLEAASASAQVSFTVERQPRKPKFKPPLDRLKY